MAKIQVVIGDSVNISLEGRMLVEGSRYEQVKMVPDTTNNGFVRLVWESDNGSLEISGGRINSMFESRDVLVKGFWDKLNQFVIGVVEEVNAIHRTGFGLDGGTNRNFFVNAKDLSGDNIDLSTIAFNPQLNNYDNIAAGEEPIL